MAEVSADGRARRTPHTFLLHEHLLDERLIVYAMARYAVAAAMAAGAVFARRVAGIEGLDVRAFLFLAALLAVYNTAAVFLIRSWRERPCGLRCHRRLERVMHGTIALDFVFLTVALWLVGGPRSPFQAFYILNVILACVLLTLRAAVAHAAFAYALFALMVIADWRGWLPSQTPAGAIPGEGGPIDGRYALTVLAVQGMLMAFSIALLTSLTHVLRLGERQLREKSAEIERIAALRRDFLHIALHDLQSPVAAAQSLLDALDAGHGLSDQQEALVDRSRERLMELNSFLRDLRTLATLERSGLEGRMETVDPAELLRSVADEHAEEAVARNHEVEVEAPPGLPPFQAVPRLLHEAIANFHSNAIKYTPEGGRIVLRAASERGWVRLEVEDNGIGVSQEGQQRLFREFVRLRKEDERLGKVAGTGLGLSIVRRIIEAHGGRVGVESREGEGSRFYAELPARQAAGAQERPAESG